MCCLLLGWNQALPEKSSARNYIDRHIESVAGERQLSLVPEADRNVLIRRLSFDLTGLPPDPEWYRYPAGPNGTIESLVDALIASPHFGERLASMWLNVARYAEDQAHQVGDNVEHFYPNAFRYRQWVVDAFNADLPFDRFVKLQLAADRYSFARDEDLPALGFLGLGPKYYQRGRLDVMADEWEDQVDTVTRGFLGLTVACARCHDHKYDPISTEDYHALAGIFASVELVNVPYEKSKTESEQDKEAKRRNTIHIVRDAKIRNLNVFIRGDVERPGAAVPRRFLSLFYEGTPPPFSEGSGRRELAEAIASPDNPLTAKVFVNRIWQMLIGKGLVRTASNFGALGEKPSHPELLEELAARFKAQGWSTKKLVREIVLSAAYRRSSEPHAAGDDLDPDNRYLWRMNRRRLPVEMWRDSLLSVTGNLDRQGGRSLELNDPANRRRTLYGRVSRLKLNPLLAHYDYPDPNIHSGGRTSTTTPLQKLYLLNNPFVAEQAQDFARRLQQETADDLERIRKAYRYLYFRTPAEEEERLGLKFLLADQSDSSHWDRYAQTLLISNEAFYLD